MTSPARLDEFFALCEDPICVLRSDGSFELTNAALEGLIGLDENPSTTFIEGVHPDDRDATEKAVREASESGGASVRFTNRFGGKNGVYRIVEWRGRSHPDSGLLYILGADVTTAQKTAVALEASRQNLHALVTVAAQGILTVDHTGRVLTANPMAAAIFGYDEGELVGLSIEALLPESARATHARHRASYAETPSPRAMGQGLDLKGLRKDGTLVPLEISLSHFYSDEGVIVVALVSDITERRRAQSETRQLERRLEHATKMEAVGRLAGGIAHDFNNLLTALSGFAEIVLDELPEDHPLCEGALEVKRTCQRSVSMVRRLLSASRQEAAQATVLDVGAKVTELSRMLKGLLGDDVALRVDVSQDAPRARLVEGQLEQVVLNLVVNAKDALPAHGRIDISVDGLEDAGRGRRSVRLRVSDNGHGMTEEVSAQIFEPFFTTRSQGTGLGLAMVKSIVKRSGGSITVESVPGEGTRFDVIFPESRAEATEIEDPESVSSESAGRAASPRGTETVLVAETENSVRLVAAESLRRAGYEVLEASDSAEALRLSQEHRGELALVLTDVIMPHESGPELVRRLRKQHPRLRALFMSGYPPHELTQHGLDEHADTFLGKPFSREALTRLVRRALDDGRGRSGG